METTSTPLPPCPPGQVPPVCREPWQEPQEGRASDGVRAARSGCAELWGPARQMCYAQRSQEL